MFSRFPFGQCFLAPCTCTSCRTLLPKVNKEDVREMKHCLLFGKLYDHPEVPSSALCAVPSCLIHSFSMFLCLAHGEWGISGSGTLELLESSKLSNLINGAP